MTETHDCLDAALTEDGFILVCVRCHEPEENLHIQVWHIENVFEAIHIATFCLPHMIDHAGSWLICYWCRRSSMASPSCAVKPTYPGPLLHLSFHNSYSLFTTVDTFLPPYSWKEHSSTEIPMFSWLEWGPLHTRVIKQSRDLRWVTTVSGYHVIFPHCIWDFSKESLRLANDMQNQMTTSFLHPIYTMSTIPWKWQQYDFLEDIVTQRPYCRVPLHLPKDYVPDIDTTGIHSYYVETMDGPKVSIMSS